MLRMAVLGSGSLGNAVVIEASNTRILVDAGLSARQLVKRLQELNIDIDSLSGILLTHEHGDHTRGLDVLMRNRQIPVFTNALTREVLGTKIKSAITWRLFENSHSFALENLTITAFPVQHDAADPVGFVIQRGEARVGVATDLGHITNTVRTHLTDLDGLFVESNYDQKMLQDDTKRPFSTKQRISSRHGHLSNDQVIELLADIATPRLRQIIIGHISKDCNCSTLIKKNLAECLEKKGLSNVPISCASQDDVCGWFDLLDRVPIWQKTPSGLQGELF